MRSQGRERETDRQRREGGRAGGQGERRWSWAPVATQPRKPRGPRPWQLPPGSEARTAWVAIGRRSPGAFRKGWEPQPVRSQEDPTGDLVPDGSHCPCTRKVWSGGARPPIQSALSLSLVPAVIRGLFSVTCRWGPVRVFCRIPGLRWRLRSCGLGCDDNSERLLGAGGGNELFSSKRREKPQCMPRTRLCFRTFVSAFGKWSIGHCVECSLKHNFPGRLGGSAG